MGLEVSEIERHGHSLPLVVRDKGNIYVLNMGHQQKADNDFISPYIVNGAFSLELHLKLLAFLESGSWSRKHRLDDLHGQLSSDSRKAIEASIEKDLAASKFLRTAIAVLKSNGVDLIWKAEELLKRSSDAYVNWRYAFDTTPGCFAGYTELQRALKALIDAKRGA